MNDYLLLLPLAFLAYVQNMAFTWASRSRNSGSPEYHRYAAWASNGTWFVTQTFIWKTLWNVVTTGNWLLLAATGVVYISMTTEGSVHMMRILLKREKGNQRVGAR